MISVHYLYDVVPSDRPYYRTVRTYTYSHTINVFSADSVMLKLLRAGLCIALSAKAASNCADWAHHGECERNPAFMWASCAQECRARHANHSAFCVARIAVGHCVTDAEGMMNDCPHTCFLDTPSQQALTIETPPESSSCAAWAQAGECERNAPFMLEACALACEQIKTMYDASDEACEMWALHGECERNSVWMLKACGAACERVSSTEAQTSPPPTQVSAQARPAVQPSICVSRACIPVLHFPPRVHAGV